MVRVSRTKAEEYPYVLSTSGQAAWAHEVIAYSLQLMNTNLPKMSESTIKSFAISGYNYYFNLNQKWKDNLNPPRFVPHEPFA
jgi:hypothetical protein